MRTWRITVEAWPYSTGAGSEADQKAAGARSANYDVKADGLRDVVRLAEAIAMGVSANPHVWRAPIVSIVQMPEGF